MLNKKEKTNQFKSDLRSVRRWRKEIEEINFKLIEVGNDLLGVSSPIIKQIVVSEGYKSNSDYRRLEWLELENNLIEDRKRLRGMIDATIKRLEKIKNEEDKKLIEELYLNIKRCSDERIAHKFGYSKRGMYNRIEKIIDEIY